MYKLYEILDSTIAEWDIERETTHHWFTPDGFKIKKVNKHGPLLGRQVFTTKADAEAFSRMRAGAATARHVIQRAIVTLLDTDTSDMGADEEKFVDALKSLHDPSKAMDALDVLDRISHQYASVLPQVRKAVDRIRPYVQLLVSRVRSD